MEDTALGCTQSPMINFFPHIAFSVDFLYTPSPSLALVCYLVFIFPLIAYLFLDLSPSAPFFCRAYLPSSPRLSVSVHSSLSGSICHCLSSFLCLGIVCVACLSDSYIKSYNFN
ncbi:hypothetical protein Pst134EA_000864 [Puccinia striiformis f. sp. tritici]|uniref:hypothetical protein n=1 Tax=Puccinia striiformis f. sp. tritici TaxID=168172 RepID=UPI002007625E|nr:hypothetical protein Pst134EA_000864 [Puccinia striiformis f. sp. tritici]KAH9473799.1 hypothetical protein Pst134EA_000864 [Puccinia striiformis f. sp. tritici]